MYATYDIDDRAIEQLKLHKQRHDASAGLYVNRLYSKALRCEILCKIKSVKAPFDESED